MSPAPFQNVQDRSSVYSISSRNLFSLRGGSKPECHPKDDCTSSAVSYNSTSAPCPDSSTIGTTTISSTTSSTTTMNATESDATKTGPSTSSTRSLSAPPSSSSNSSEVNAGESTSSDSTGSRRNTGAIIGGVIGGVVILSIAALILFIFLRRRRRMKHTAPSAEFLQRLNSVKQGSPLKRTRSNSIGDAHSTGGKTFLQSSPTLEKVAVDTSGYGP